MSDNDGKDVQYRYACLLCDGMKFTHLWRTVLLHYRNAHNRLLPSHQPVQLQHCKPIRHGLLVTPWKAATLKDLPKVMSGFHVVCVCGCKPHGRVTDALTAGRKRPAGAPAEPPAAISTHDKAHCT